MDSSALVPQQTSDTACSKDRAMELLKEAFQLIISGGVDLRDEPEFCIIVDQLCEKAPEAAEAIVGTIQKSPKIDSLLFHSKISATRKRKSSNDPIYRPSKSARKISNLSDNANLLSTENDVKEQEHDIEEDPTANTEASVSCEMGKLESQVAESQERFQKTMQWI